ncbi:glycosyltransferase [Kordiimonas sp.]|uniref:glycosyltransferase n=1 Tax=Kordiimonas sp. TaxID=1970157 RepID=UPI003A925F9E
MVLRFSVVICSFNRHKLLACAIDSVLQQNFPDDRYDIIVVDNSSDMTSACETRETYAPLVPRIRYLVEDTPGLSRARNVALQISTAEYIVFLDDDAVASEDWLQQLDMVLNDQRHDIGVIGGRVRPNWESPPPGWLLPTDVDPVEVNNHEFPMVGNFSVVNWGGETREPAEGEWLAGANLAFNREALLAAGGFDQGLGRHGNGYSLLSNEEGNAIRKIKTEGWRVLYAPHAVVDHWIPDERISKAWLVRRVSWQMVSDLIEDGAKLPLSGAEILRRFEAMSGVDSQTAQENTEAVEFRKRILAYAALVQTLLVGDTENLEKAIWGNTQIDEASP